MKFFSIKILLSISTSIIILGCIPITAFANEPKVLINGQPVKFNQPLLSISGILLAPIQTIADSMKAKHYWDKEVQTATVSYGDTIAIISTIDTNYMKVQNVKRVEKKLIPTGESKIVSLPISPKNYNGVAYFPIEAIARALLGDKNITWDRISNTLWIRIPSYSRPSITPEYEYSLEAIKDYNEAIKLNPNNASAYRKRGRAYYMKGQYDLAIQDFNIAIKLDPNDAYAYGFRGDVYRMKEQGDIAIKDFNEAIRLNPNNALAYRGRGDVYRMKGQYDIAIKNYDEAIKLDPRYASAYCDRGKAYLSKSQYDTAIKDFNEAIRLEPNNASAYNNRGMTYYVKYLYDTAIKDFNEAIRLNPNNASAYIVRGDTYRRKGQYDTAIKDFNEAIRLNPNNALAYSGLEEIYKERRQYDAAIQEYEKYPVTPKYESSLSLNTIGVSIGTSFATPVFISTIHGTFAPISNMYLELGLDWGLVHNRSSGQNYYYSVDGYYSLYPFVNAGYFLPFTNESDWYLGAGVGYMFGKYTFEDGNAYINIPAFNIITGFIINNFFNISYTLRTNFEGVSNKIAAGIVYRFE